jgi:antirestriction protein ArdC
MNTPTASQAFAAERAADLLAQVKAGVAGVRSSQDWSKWLAQGARFYRYSFCNSMLITLAKPGATYVKGFQAWKSLGRTVKKGEKGIPILAPVFIKRENEGADGDATVQRVRFFKTVFVFDVSQTEGQDLDLVDIAPVLKGDGAALLSQLRASATALGFVVREEVLAADLGGFVEHNRFITLNSANDSLHQARTLIHELAHGLLKHCGSVLPRERKELAAETAAWIVCRELGVDADAYSFGYLAAWSAQTKDFAAQLEAAAEAAFKAARLITNALAVEQKASVVEA